MTIRDFTPFVQSLRPAMATLLLGGYPACIDSYGRARTISANLPAGPAWRKDDQGWWFGQNQSLVASGMITIADAAELRFQAGATLFWTARNFNSWVADGGVRVLSKRDAGGVIVDVFMGGVVNQLAIYDGTVTRFAATALLANSRSVAIRFVSGATPQLFVNGNYVMDFSGAITPPNDDAPLTLANFLTGAYGTKNVDYGFFGIFSDAILGRQITNQEIADLHDSALAIPSVFTPKRTIWPAKKAQDVVATAPILHWAGARTPAGVITDLSGNGRDGTISGRVSQAESRGQYAQWGYGVGDPMIIAATDVGQSPTNITVSCLLVNRGLGQSNQGCYFALNDNLTYRAELINAGAATVMYWIDTYTDGAALWRFPVPALSGDRDVHVVVKHNRADPTVSPTVFVDGEQQVVTVIVGRAGALSANAAPRISMLNRGAVDLDPDGGVKDLRVYNSLLPNADCRALYLDHALQTQVLAHRTDSAVSVAAVATPGNAGPWRGLLGSLLWSDDGTKRYITSSAGGYIVSREPSSQAYGAWYCRAKKVLDIDSVYIPLVSNIPKIPSGTAGFNGYQVTIGGTEAVALWRWTGGVATVIATTAAGAVVLGTEYEFFVTRRARDGYFVVWIRGGAYATWTSLLTGTDANHTTSACLVGYVDSGGGYIADFTMFPNGGTLLPTEVPWLI